MQPISLLEELLLLTLEDEGGEFDRVPDIFLTYGAAGAVLMDLALQNRIDSDLEGLWAVSTEPTGDAMLDEVLVKLAAEPRRLSTATWLERLSASAIALRQAALARLCERGILRQTDAQYLWVLKARRYPVIGGQEHPEAKRRIMRLLFTDDIPEPREIALTALAQACFVFERILTPREYAGAQARIAQIAGMDLIGAGIARSAHEASLHLQQAERRTVLAGLAGNVMEWFDFGIYGYFAAIIGRQFFTAENPAVSLLASFGVFAVGFLGRPLGGVVFGHIGDRMGRRTAVISSVMMMILPTLLMSILPTYAQIGLLAPVGLILLRLLQGLAVGGEYTTSMVLLVESAQPSRRGLLGSYTPLGSVGGMLLGSLVGAGLLACISPEQAESWGWRIPFVIGVLIGGIVLLIRRKLPADDHIVAQEQARESPLLEAFRTQWTTIAKVGGLSMANGIGFYLVFVFMPGWLEREAHMASSATLALNSIALLILILALPVAGILSDRVGRQPLVIGGCILLALVAWPLIHLMSRGEPLPVLAGQGLLALVFALLCGSIPAYMVEAFPKHVRCSGLSVGYNVAVSIFGGTVPLVCSLLNEWTGYDLAFSFYMMLAALVSMLCAFTIRLHESPHP